jgi:hypothetical protein
LRVMRDAAEMKAKLYEQEARTRRAQIEKILGHTRKDDARRAALDGTARTFEALAEAARKLAVEITAAFRGEAVIIGDSLNDGRRAVLDADLAELRARDAARDAARRN